MQPFNPPLANEFPAAPLFEFGTYPFEVIQAVNGTERGELCLGAGRDRSFA